MPARPIPVVLMLALAGCGAELELYQDEQLDSSAFALSLPAADAAALLDFVNHPGTELPVLDSKVGLDVRAARNIIAYRDGADGVTPSADDNRFDTITELDAVPYVGDAALTRLRDYAVAYPPPPGELVEGVAFLGWQAESVIWAANGVTRGELTEIGLSTRAADNIILKRPFSTVGAIGAVPYVGSASLVKLRDHALTWWNAKRGIAATSEAVYDGVAFDAAAERVALNISNQATYQQLTQEAKVYASGASAITSSRPYATLGAVANLSGVGTVTMQALHDYAVSGTWSVPPSPGDCSTGIALRGDADVADLDRLLELATTLDWPYAEVVAFQATACTDMGDASHRDAVFEEMVATPYLDWTYSRTVYPEGEDFMKPASRFVALMDYTKQAIQDRVAGGVWSPSSPDEQTLYSRLGTLHQSLTAAPRANPSAFYEATLRIEAAECSQDAAVLMDPTNNRIWVVHRFPRC
ncbi:MAG: hypothetical protein HYZ28_19520 [Myxococcales bacterium]|nr:hypothetical protein [Myxococcales bacterium]